MKEPLAASCVVAFVALTAATALHAQPASPDGKPITMIVPFPPSGVADAVARPVAESLSRELKTTVVAENRAGAGGATGIGAASRAGRRLCRAAEPVVDFDPARGRTHQRASQPMRRRCPLTRPRAGSPCAYDGFAAV